MEIEFDVHMSTGKLYDYSLYHTYRGFTGLFGTAVGAVLLFYFVRSSQPMYLIFGLITILYLPIALYVNAKKQMLMVAAFKEPLHYRLSAEGIEISQGEEKQTQGWDGVLKAVSTGQSIILYTGKAVASILPRDDMGEQTEQVIKMISQNVSQKRVKIRF